MAAEEPLAPPSLPQYPVMIMAAIEALNDKNGSNKSAISKHIEAAASGDVPAAHATLLSHHLNKMKQSGQLVMVKNNYMKPDPNAPPRRGRGRPPKPKAQSAPGAEEASPPRPRGRPPKSTDPLAPPPATKKAKTDASAAPPPSGERRGRGRPPKVKPAVAAPVRC
ncbi:HMG-Y-related protein A [Camellia lanceoleosa]|uniref:HMG-Y-related protein A n=1 Tax=Camellia lanceoleosa TaxID=1840588 RepID=A0ACC0IAM1_9ERIC|nr:HMG-Y-related protein A [Camellia lanceoleosa]